MVLGRGCRRKGRGLGSRVVLINVPTAATAGGGLSIYEEGGGGANPTGHGTLDRPTHTPCRHPPAGGEKMSDEGQIRELRLNLSRS